MRLLELSNYSGTDGFIDLCVVKKNLNNQFTEDTFGYDLYGPDSNGLTWHIRILKNSDDATDFVANRKAAFNFAIGIRSYSFSTSDFDFQRKGVFATVNTTEFDIFVKVWDDNLYLNGGTMYCGTGFTFGDWAEMAIVDHDNLLGYGVDFVLKTWILSSYPAPDGKCEITTPYAGKPPENMYIRVKYHRTGSADIPVVVNLNFHKAI